MQLWFDLTKYIPAMLCDLTFCSATRSVARFRASTTAIPDTEGDRHIEAELLVGWAAATLAVSLRSAIG